MLPRQPQRRVTRLAVYPLLLLGLAAAQPSRAAGTNNPLNTVVATANDGVSPDIKSEDCQEGGKNLSSVHNGDFAVYKSFDFDSGVAAFRVRLASTRSGTIEVHLDKADGPLMGTVAFKPTGGWQSWDDAVCPVNNSLSGVRDIYLVFHGAPGGAVVNISRFVFLKSLPIAKQQGIDLSSRLDVVDNEPQAVKAWGMPEKGFSDNFDKNALKNWTAVGLTVSSNAIDGKRSISATGANPAFAYTPDVYLNKTDTGGEWRTMAEGSLSADLVIDSPDARPGIGFTSKDGKQRVYVVLNPVATAIDDLRLIMLHGEWPSWGTSALALGWSLLLLVLGYALFKRLERGFADRV